LGLLNIKGTQEADQGGLALEACSATLIKRKNKGERNWWGACNLGHSQRTKRVNLKHRYALKE